MNATAGLTIVQSRLADFRDRHAGEDIIVCGCGESLNLLSEPQRFVTIGVNDVGRRFDPDYLVVLNSAPQFSGDRFKFVQESQARAVFSHLRLSLTHAPVVSFQLGRRGGVELEDPNSLPYTRNSPYVAVALAAHMGARRIGLIGVDFTTNHFFAATGTHPLARELAQIAREYQQFAEALAKRGVELVNLSPVSRLDTLPRMSPDVFAGGAKGDRAMDLVSYATTPVAGVPPVLARCVEARTPHRARTVWATDDYGNGVRFEGDVEWKRRPREAEVLLEAADLAILHNGRIDPKHARILIDKPALVLAHNYMWNVDDRRVRTGAPGLVVGQYQAAEPEFASWTAVPNPVPLWEPDYMPAAKGERIVIAYTPSGRHERYPRDHRLYWHGKGYDTTMRVLSALARRHDIELAVIGRRQVSHAESLAMKRRAHIVIDECVTGSYHRNSLEGLAAGAVVVNGLGLEPAIADVFRRMAPGAETFPFETTDLANLEVTLERLIAAGPVALAERGAANRRWMERHWAFGDQWSTFWLPAVHRALGDPPRMTDTTLVRPAVAPTPAPAPAPAPSSTTGLKVIVPHGGAERLRLLDASLAQLARCRGVASVLVVEMDPEAGALEICRRHGATHLHVREPFEKTRAMNAGLAFVDTPYFLWLDNDLLVPEGFLERALSECQTRGLDCLVPWERVRYLSEADSERVHVGACEPDDCRPVRELFSRQGVWGGAVLVRTEFALRFGGMVEAYRGYGQEDNGWFLKARILGRAAVTRDRGAHLNHLYHPLSGGHPGQNASVYNPHFQENLRITQRIRAARTASAFLRAFPPPTHPPAPWAGRARVACADAARPTGEALLRLFGDAAVELCPPGTADAVTAEPPGALSPEAAARRLALRIAAETSAETVPEAALPVAAAIPAATWARETDLAHPVFAAFNRGHRYPRMRQWELPFAWLQGRFGPIDRVADCSINPCGLGGRLAETYPHLAYRHLPAIAQGRFAPPAATPDGCFDRAICLNTFEHLLASQRAELMAELGRMLRPGGRLVVTCDQYPADFWDRPALQTLGVMTADRAEIFNGWNRVDLDELVRLAEAVGLRLAGTDPGAPADDLYRNQEPYPHGVLGAVFEKADPTPAPARRIALALNAASGATPEALQAWRAEARLLEQFGHRPILLLAARDTQGVLAEGEVAVPLDSDAPAEAASRLAQAALAHDVEAVLLLDAGLHVAPGGACALLARLSGLGSGVAALAAADIRPVRRTPLPPVLSVTARPETEALAAGCVLLRASAVPNLRFERPANASGLTVTSASGAIWRVTDLPLAHRPPPPRTATVLSSPASAPSSPASGSPGSAPASPASGPGSPGSLPTSPASAPGSPAGVASLAPAVTIARATDLSLPEFVAFNHGHAYPRMRRWELPFALSQARLDDGMAVLDCSQNPVDFGARLQALYADLRYDHWSPIQADVFTPLAETGEAYDRVFCINTLEHLEPTQRAGLVAAMTRRLKPGGRLVVTCDYYFDGTWADPKLQALGVVRADQTPFVGGWNRVAPAELIALGLGAGLRCVGDAGATPLPDEADATLYRNDPPCPHAALGAVFDKPGDEARPFRRRRLLLSLLSWNTRAISVESAQALLREAAMLRRFGHEASVVVCDNGSTDGSPEAFRALPPEPGVTLEVIANTTNLGNCLARNQIIDAGRAASADFVLFNDGDIEIMPFSVLAMMRRMEQSGPSLGCLGAHSMGHVRQRARITPAVYSLARMQIIDTQMIAFTQYGLFRREMFDAGVRFETAAPFDGAGWGFEDNDLAFQIQEKGFAIQFFKGATYLHRDMRSSVPIMRREGHDPNLLIRQRKDHVIRKWETVPRIAEGPLPYLRTVNIRL